MDQLNRFVDEYKCNLYESSSAEKRKHCLQYIDVCACANANGDMAKLKFVAFIMGNQFQRRSLSLSLCVCACECEFVCKNNYSTFHRASGWYRHGNSIQPTAIAINLLKPIQSNWKGVSSVRLEKAHALDLCANPYDGRVTAYQQIRH